MSSSNNSLEDFGNFIAMTMGAFVLCLFIVIGVVMYNENRFTYGSETVIGHELTVVDITDHGKFREVMFRDGVNFYVITEHIYRSREYIRFKAGDRVTMNYTRKIIYRDGKYYDSECSIDENSLDIYVDR